MHEENQLLKETLGRMKVVQPGEMDSEGQSSPEMDPEEEELMRMRYFEALRRQHFEDQMRKLEEQRSSGGAQPFKTPNVISFNYEDLDSYGSQINTASANYRPGNSKTRLRKKKE